MTKPPPIPIRFQSTLPQGEATLTLTSGSQLSNNFNPRSHKGSDSQSHHICCRRSNFNPRSHKGSDVTGALHCKPTNYFNPRSHKGSDSSNPFLYQRFLYFNPRSHKGSDAILVLSDVSFTISIHAPTRGATESLQ